MAKKILSIDGGGILGLFPAVILAEIEEDLKISMKDHFDLIAGTSTGGIIAIALSLGIPAKDIVKLYISSGPKIFKGYDEKLNDLKYYFDLYWKSKTKFSKYDNEALKTALKHQFKDYKLKDCKTLLAIPSFNISQSAVHIYRNYNLDGVFNDSNTKLVDVALATSAAPMYLPAYKSYENDIFIDGGIGSNNPSSIALIDAIGILKWNSAEIKVLSLGCISRKNLKLETKKDKYKLSEPDLIDAFFAAESQNAENACKILLNDNEHENYIRINHYDDEGIFKIDGISKTQLKEMIRLAQIKYNIYKKNILDMIK